MDLFDNLFVCGKEDSAQTIVQGLTKKIPVKYIISGDETSGPIVEKLTSIFTPDYSNDYHTSDTKFKKYCMQEALRYANIPNIKQRKIKINEIKSSINKNVRYVSDELIIQEFLEGQEFLVDSFTYNGKHFISGAFPCEKIFINGVSLYRNITMFPQKNAFDIIEYCKLVLTTLGVKNGLVNTDLMKAGSSIYLLEINSRIVGCSGLISNLEKLTLGYNQATLLAKCISGQLSVFSEFAGNVNNGYGKIVGLQNVKTLSRKPVFQENNMKNLNSYVSHKWYIDGSRNLSVPESLLEWLCYLIEIKSSLKKIMKGYYKWKTKGCYSDFVSSASQHVVRHRPMK